MTWDGEWNDKALLPQLLTFAKQLPRKPVLFYQRDEDLLFVNRNRDALASAFDFVLAPDQLIAMLVDKIQFAVVARKLRLPIPETAVISPAASEVPRPGELAFPLVIKPATRLHHRWLALEPDRKAIPIQNLRELAELWGRLASSGEQFIAQAMIAGGEEDVESYHVYVDAGGSVAGEFTGRKLRTRPEHYGHTTALEITDADDVRSVGRDVVEQLGLTGVAKVDFKRGPRGDLYLFEVNPRFNLWHHPGAVAGVNLPATVFADVVGIPRAKGTAARAGVAWVRAEDLLAARDRGLPLIPWLRWAARCEAKKAFALDDPLPIAAGVLRRSRRALRSTLASRHHRGQPRH